MVNNILIQVLDVLPVAIIVGNVTKMKENAQNAYKATEY